MNHRSFRFGAVAAFARTAQEWTATARRVEELGFSTLLCPDTVGTLAPFSALTAAATATTTLRLGTYVLASPLRRPAAVAWETASLDLLSGGRFDLGLGAGRPGSEHDARRLGVPFGTPGERIEQLEQTLEAVRARYARTDPAAQRDALRGVQHPHPPILIAGAGPRMLRLAAEHADALALGLPPTSTDEDLEAKTRQLREIDEGAFERLALNVNIALVGDQAPPGAASWLGADPRELLRIGSITALDGTPREMADTLLRRRERTGVSYLTVNAMFAEQFAPVLELLAGA
jgi:probable F420-dependent oxidoreductase